MGHIYDITPFTLIDYPDELACIVWISGCNLRCVYCHNPEIVKSKGRKDDAELLSFLETRRGKLTSVVFSGGEATFYPTLPELMKKTKAMGFKVKLDTNGCNPDVLRELIRLKLLDYVALDYKAPPEKAEKVISTAQFVKEFYESLDFLIKESKKGHLTLEVRTTAAPDFLNEDDINWIISDLEKRGYQGTYWVQNVTSSGEGTLGNIARPERTIDTDLLKKPEGFNLDFRNFPPKPNVRPN